MRSLSAQLADLRSPDLRIAFVLRGFLAGLLFLAVLLAWSTILPSPPWPQVGIDLTLYRDATARWVETGSFYHAYQIARPYEISFGDILYPPPFIAVMLPFLVLPAFLWWAIPILVTGAVVIHHRPSTLGWLLVAILLAWPIGWTALIAGNPVLWIMAAVALATIRPFAGPFVLLKPTLAPFALVGVRRTGWWAGVAALALLSALFLPLWPEYVEVVLHARGVQAGPLYSALQASLPAIPVAAALTSRRG